MRIRVLVFLALCQSSLMAQSPESVVFLIGDCGEPTIRNSTIGRVLRREARQSVNASIVFLGDNIYPFGMPGTGFSGRERAEDILRTQAGWSDSTDAKAYFIPGNHDWQHWSRQGWEYVVNQQLFIDSLNNPRVAFHPKGGCPGPIEIPLSANAVLIILDSQWLLHAYDKPGEESDCFAKDPAAFMILLDDALSRNRGKRVFVAAHHPVISYGDHGGVFGFQDHVFPLRDLQRHLYIPMPVIGSLYPFYRGVFGHPQDIKHPNYKAYSRMIQQLLSQHPGSVYAAGHEHALQHIEKDSVFYIVSGSGSKTGYVRKGRYARLAAHVEGFVKVSNMANGKAIVQYWQVDKAHPEGKVIFEETLPSVKALQQETPPAPSARTKGMVRVNASDQYHAGKMRRFFLGSNYRDAWAQPIEVPVFYLDEMKGGMKILQKGGGQQTLSLRLADSTGREYVLRSVEKNPENAVPEMFRKTFAQDLVQDQISASHPYAALIIPPLADAAGIYHTNPRLVYIADDPSLGIYRKQFGDMLALFEERPDEDWSDRAHFGNSKDIVNTSKVLEQLQKDSDNKVDQQFVARSRIFDLWIGDWDRHDDQWRWASYEKGKEKRYRPIPRDRDQAFFVNEGVLAKIWSRRWALPKFEGFDEEINWPPGLSFNARFFDRSFLNAIGEEEWIRQARDLQQRMSDDVIEGAVATWPEPIYKLHGAEIVKRLKARREDLVDNAREYYRFLSRVVDVPASDKQERFTVTRKDNGDVNVRVDKIRKGGDPEKVYERDFRFGETREIRLYGLGDDDEFVVDGNAPRSIKVRIIGGSGKDSVRDNSAVTGWGRKTVVYDLKGTGIGGRSELKDMTSRNPAVNEYNRKDFRYNRFAPLVIGSFNPDDGLFIGGGFLFQREGFRKNPFQERHIFLGSVAPRTNSFNFLYRGDFTDVFGRWGLAIDADLKSPNYVNNFFGLGNETVFNQDIEEDPAFDLERDIDYYRFRFEEFRIETYLTRRVGQSQFSIGPAFQQVEVEDPRSSDRFIQQYASGLDYNLFEEQNKYAGVSGRFVVDNRNNRVLTTRGAHLTLAGRAMKGLDERANDFGSFETAMSLYHSFNWSRNVVFAGRVGGGRTAGNYDFYQSQILGGRTELRGFRKTRFHGDSKFYTNLEVRAKLFSVRTYLFPAAIGILAFHDVGRVWYKDETGIDPSAGGTSNAWHKGWGGGIWFTPFNMTVLSIEAGHSEEETLGYVRLGFLF